VSSLNDDDMDFIGEVPKAYCTSDGKPVTVRYALKNGIGYVWSHRWVGRAQEIPEGWVLINRRSDYKDAVILKLLKKISELGAICGN